ncbi:MAG TPA: energy transducer TonB [Pyrinomonadaceae bacterium]|nr:energy transducer TonB [Pyrinomonadaceae bacterium]
MKQKETNPVFPKTRTLIFAFIIQIFIVAAAFGQAAPPPSNPPVPQNSPGPVTPAVTPTGPTESELLQKRLERARALAAAHQLSAAATEMESIRALVKDGVVRNNSTLMLMGIYLEDGNYARAESLLEETFKERAQKKEASVGTYFALAGQAVNGARAHMARYRLFGINVSSPSMPPEAIADLDRLRSLLERMSAQGKELIRENAKANDAFALLEDISGIRTILARDSEDRSRWETERSLARAHMATLPTEIASIGGVPSLPPDVVETTRNMTPAVAAAAVVTAPQDTAKGIAVSGENKGTSPSVPPLGSGALEVGSLTDKAVSRVTPAYPQMAKNAGISGLVRIKIVVDEAGSVAGIVWAEGPMLLRQAAQDALRQWKFQPTVIDGKPVKATGYVDFGFSR